jgi:multimeric flavodoxin WrbA
MKITILNGSPKGKQSVTMQYVHFIQQQFPQHEFKILHVAQQIRKLEKDAQAFQEILDDVASSDGVLWAFPLYSLLVHSDYKRFIELIWERDAQHVFAEKYTASLSTSIHFYDHTAHNYIHAICDDLGMRLVDVYSAGMRDLFEEDKQRSLRLFAERLFEAIDTNAPAFKRYAPISFTSAEYTPGEVIANIDTGNQKVLVITDAEDEKTNEWKMVERFRSAFTQPVKVMNLHDLDMKGGCMGCIQCGYDNTCAWEDKDGYVEFYKTKVQTADVLIFAGTIKDRYLSSRWKSFLDRRFFNTHSPTLLSKQFGFLISGPLSQVPNLRQILEAFVEFQHSNIVGFVTDEWGDSITLDAQIQRLAAQSIWSAEQRYLKPQTFLGVGAMKVFRDEIWGPLRFVFQADHRYYKEHGFYDFPQREYKTRALNALGSVIMKLKGFRERFYKKEMKPGMVRGFQKVLSQS